MKYNKANFSTLQKIMSFVSILLLIAVVVVIYLFLRSKNPNNNLKIEDSMVSDKYYNLVRILGQPTYLEKSRGNKLNSATWMSPLNNFHDFGKYGGCDYLKIHGYPAKKYHPHPAIVFLIVGKYMKVPDHLFGPLKYASETINIEQLFVPDKYADKYQKTGEKELALVTGSCASVIISVITVRFVEEMIEQYQNQYECLSLYDTFRKEYDRRIDDYLCGRGITDAIPWFDHNYFEEPEIYNIGKDKCEGFENHSGIVPNPSPSYNSNNSHNSHNSHNSNNNHNSHNSNNNKKHS